MCCGNRFSDYKPAKPVKSAGYSEEHLNAYNKMLANHKAEQANKAKQTSVNLVNRLINKVKHY